jgi:hydroxymethylpyrimidine/phosphomethylpyrimidine kinase
VYGEAVITLVTVQNTRMVSRVEVMRADLVVDQLRAVIGDIPPHAAKTGALGTVEAIETIAAEAATWTFPLVVDPVMISKHGAPLIAEEATSAVRTRLLPRAALITPNLHEAAALAGRTVHTVPEMRDAARALHELGAAAVLVKGGHLEGDAVDLLYDGSDFEEFRSERVDTPHTHGTGCTYASAITAQLAIGLPMRHAVRVAKRFITEAIRTNPRLGSGHGPVNHFAPTERR